MKDWEQIVFAVALAGFGWLLFAAHNATPKSDQSGIGYNANVAPWYLNFNAVRGFTGPLAATQSVSGNIAGPDRFTSMGDENSSGCTLCNFMSNL